MINITRESVAKALYGMDVAHYERTSGSAAPATWTFENLDDKERQELLRDADAFIARVDLTVHGNPSDWPLFGAGAAEPPKPVFVPMPLATLYAAYDALRSLTFDEFYAALHSANGCNEQYARGVWVPFQDAPVWFLQSRTPQSQAEALFATALLKMARGGT